MLMVRNKPRGASSGSGAGGGGVVTTASQEAKKVVCSEPAAVRPSGAGRNQRRQCGSMVNNVPIMYSGTSPQRRKTTYEQTEPSGGAA